MNFEKNQIIAHRGFSLIQTENTVESIQEAHNSGVNWVEIDIQMTLDGRLIVFHDFDLNRLANINKKIQLSDWGELKKVKLINKKTGENNLRILSFDTLINLALKLNLSLNIELKTENKEKKFLKTFAKLVFDHLQKIQDNSIQILISSFSYPLLKQFSLLSNQYPLGLLIENCIPDDLEGKLKNIQAFSVHFEKSIVNKGLINRIKKLNYRILVFTVDNVTEAKHLFKMGVDGVFSNDCNLGKKGG